PAAMVYIDTAQTQVSERRASSMTSSKRPRPDSKPGRNEPCPCGSGKKYKRCHGQLPRGAPEVTATSEDSSAQACNTLAASARELYDAGKPDQAFDQAAVVFERGHMCGAWEDACHLMASVLLERDQIRAAAPLIHLVRAYNRTCPMGHFQYGLLLE